MRRARECTAQAEVLIAHHRDRLNPVRPAALAHRQRRDELLTATQRLRSTVPVEHRQHERRSLASAAVKVQKRATARSARLGAAVSSRNAYLSAGG